MQSTEKRNPLVAEGVDEIEDSLSLDQIHFLANLAEGRQGEIQILPGMNRGDHDPDACLSWGNGGETNALSENVLLEQARTKLA